MAKGIRNYEVILYSIEECYRLVDICIYEGFDYAFILHDKDLKEDLSDYKDKHYHFQIYMNNQKTLENMSILLGVKQNYIQKIIDKKKAIRYLLHADHNEKANYDIIDIATNIDLTSYFNNLVSNESIDVEIILDFISRPKSISMKELFSFVLSNNCWASYRRNYAIIKDLVYEHNVLYSEDKGLHNREL